MITGSVSSFRINPIQNSNGQAKPSFKGHIGAENLAKDGIDILVHETAFFRDFETKNYVINYIKQHLANNKLIKIVVGACSTGEEAVTLSMMLNALKEKVHILGIDLSEKVIKKAQSRQYEFQIPGLQPSLIDDYAAFRDTFLAVRSQDPLTKHQDIQKTLFDEFFESVPEEKSFMGKLRNYFSNFFYGPLVKNSVKFQLKPEKALNCNFVAGDMRNLNEITKGDKSDVIFFSNALYHLVTYEADDCSRAMYFNSDKIISELAQKFKENLRPNGLVCFGEEESYQIPKIELVSEIMQNSGFEPLNVTSNHGANIFRKIN